MKCIIKFAARLVRFLILSATLFVTVTGLIYWFNLENKLIYYVIRPFLNKHYDSQVRDRRI